MNDARLADAPPAAGPAASAALPTVLRTQRKTLLVGLVLAAASFWVLGPLGEWKLAGCLAMGVGLGLVNHLATELWLMRVITAGDELSRNRMVRMTFVRLTILTVVAVAIAVAYWPSGVGVLFGLALFRLIALVMTTLPLLKELKQQ